MRRESPRIIGAIIPHMLQSVRILRSIRLRRRQSWRGPGQAALVVAVFILLAGAACFFLPYQGPAAELALGVRPAATRFYDRSGTVLMEVYASAFAGQSAWYAPAKGGCAADALRAAEAGSALQPLPAPARAMLSALTGGSDLAAEAAAELESISGQSGTPWDTARLAAALSMHYSPDTLVEWLLNFRLYGRRTVGVDDAARTFFHVPARDLRPAQCAALEALARDLSLAARDSDLAAARNLILRQMAEQGSISMSEYTSAAGSPAGLAPPEADASPFLRAYLREAEARLAKVYPGDEPARAGLRVITSLDFDFTGQALCSAQTLIMRADGADPGFIQPTLTGGACSAAALLGPLPSGGRGTDLAFAAVDPESGELLAYVDSARGGSPVSDGEAGTAITPFLYMAGFAHGITPATMLLDLPTADSTEPGLGPITARTALQQRRMAAAGAMTTRVGEESVASSLALLHFAPPAAVGGSPIDWTQTPANPLALARAFAVIAAGGLETRDANGQAPILLRRVERPDGSGLDAFSARTVRRVVGADLSYLLQDILSDPDWMNAPGTPGLAGSDSSAARALGETETDGAAWASLLAPQMAVSVRAAPLPSSRVDPAFPWTAAQASAGWLLRSAATRVWSMPDGITRQEICIPSGMLPSADCPSRRSEVFLSGTQPTQADIYYRPVAVNEETGLRATLWTSPGLVERKIFFSLPQEASLWAARSGFAVPPESYDTLPASFPCIPSLCLQSPAPLNFVRGTVAIRGVAAESGMSGYLLQAGPGLYPTAWYALGKGGQTAANAALAEWDTAGLSGIWAVELIAIRPDGSFNEVAIPVMVDNTPPALRWLSPQDGAPVALAKGDALVAQVDAKDDLALDFVEFLVDGRSVAREEAGPFSMRIPSLPAGRHSLSARAADRAGNKAALPDVEVMVGQ